MIHRLHFSIDLKAERTTIWKALWSDGGYRDWTGVFFKGSYAIADDWKEGTNVWFLGPDQNGIYSRIETHIPNELMKCKHLGNVIKGKEQPIDQGKETWSGATEVYALTEGTDCYVLTVDIDVLDEHVDFMTKTFPEALKRIKNNSC